MILHQYSNDPSLLPPGIQLITYEELEEMERAASQQAPSLVQTIRSIATEFCFMTARAFAQVFNSGSE